MRWIGWIVGLAAVGLLAAYVLVWRNHIDQEAANNNGVVCEVYVKLDSQLWSEYTSGNYLGVLLGQEAAGPASAAGKELLAEMKSALGDVESITGGKCLYSVEKMPMFQAGRIKVNVDYFRPYPAVSP